MSQSISKQNLRIREITIAIFAFLIFGVAHANLSPIARNADGTVLVTNQDAALSYCRSQGLHVPSAREWAVIGGTQGAQVMLQPSRPNSSVNDPTVEICTRQLQRERPSFVFPEINRFLNAREVI